MAAATADGLGAHDSVAALCAARDRMTRAANAARAAGASDAPEMAPLLTRSKTVAALADAKSEMAAAAADGLGAHDSVTDLRAAVERMTHAADAARAAGAGDAPEMAPLLTRLKTVAALVDLCESGFAEHADGLVAQGVMSLAKLKTYTDHDIEQLGVRIGIPFDKGRLFLREVQKQRDGSDATFEATLGTVERALLLLGRRLATEGGGESSKLHGFCLVLGDGAKLMAKDEDGDGVLGLIKNDTYDLTRGFATVEDYLRSPQRVTLKDFKKIQPLAKEDGAIIIDLESGGTVLGANYGISSVGKGDRTGGGMRHQAASAIAQPEAKKGGDCFVAKVSEDACTYAGGPRIPGATIDVFNRCKEAAKVPLTRAGPAMALSKSTRSASPPFDLAATTEASGVSPSQRSSSLTQTRSCSRRQLCSAASSGPFSLAPSGIAASMIVSSSTAYGA